MRVSRVCLSLAVWALGGMPALAQTPPVRIPDKPFGVDPPPPAPNYADPHAWAALPDREDAADVVPLNDPIGDRQASAAVDVFYIHPTTFRDGSRWNQPLDDEATNAWTDASVISRQAAVFNACCRVYAPRYRQAASAAVYAGADKNPHGAYELAWQDVRAAFLYYLKHWNKGRPFILAGHSQGAAHIQRWLEEFGADPKLRARLVAAYPIGIAFPKGLPERAFHGIGVCQSARQTACFVAWNTFARGGDPSGMLGGAVQRYTQRFGKDAPGQEIVCVNPLTFEAATPVAPAAWNLGSLPATRSKGALPATEAGRLGAECSGGALAVDPPPAEGYAIVPLPGGMLHFNDYDLFYLNIRLNALARSEAFLAAPRRAERTR